MTLTVADCDVHADDQEEYQVGSHHVMEVLLSHDEPGSANQDTSSDHAICNADHNRKW